tara:strand:- start:7759 stop:8097 length:339 start_codon:yes stop_codon:yes gene_type:complete
MATYASKTQAEKDLVAAFERDFRGWLNQLASLLISARALQASNDAPNSVATIVDDLGIGETIPNTSGISGAQGLTEADWETLTVAMDNFITATDTPTLRQAIAQAAGHTAGL